jgi:signal transduction histidine kinase
MSTIRRRFATLVVMAAVAPLVLYGLVSVLSLRRGTRESVMTGHTNVLAEASARVAQYVDDNVALLRSVAGVLRQPDITERQQTRILTSFVLDFPEFREATLVDGAGQPLASSRLGPAAPRRLDEARANGGLHLSPIDIDEDLLPKTSVTLSIDGTPDGDRWLVGDLSLEELWRTLDRIRVGQQGFALLVDADGRLLAHGDPDSKDRVARGETLDAHPLVEALARRGGADAAPLALEYDAPNGQRVLGAGVRLPLTGWRLLLEQPTTEAYAVATRLVRLLVATIALALVFTLAWGLYSARAVVRPLDTLMGATRSLAGGNLDTRVSVAGDLELVRLGESFNTMADRLAELQAETVRQERQAMFGKVAAGLAHDLAHPVQNLGNNCRLMVRMHDDADYRETFARIAEREVGIIRRMLDDLKNLARPMALERFPVDLNRSLREAVEELATDAADAGIELALDLPAEPVVVAADLFALGRVHRNLIVNAIQATPAGGRITVSARRDGGRARATVADTGCGIEPERLSAIFDDFVTTKRRGLGLGLAISRKIVEQLGGSIGVESAVGRGTTFTLEFPSAEPVGAAAGNR